MDRGGIPGAQGRADHAGKGKAGKGGKRKKRSPGVEIIELYWHWWLSGTMRVRGCSKRMRRSTELPARREFKEHALQIKRQVETNFVNQVIYGIKPSVTLGVAARRYLGLDEAGEKLPNQGKEVGPNDFKILQAVVREFSVRHLNLTTGEEWSARALRQNPDNMPATIVRYMAPVKAFLRWCSGATANGWRCRRSNCLKRRTRGTASAVASANSPPNCWSFFFDFAAPHLKAQLYTEWSTGGRVSSILFGCRLCDLILSPQRSQITFHDTKNGDTVTAHLHPAAAEALAEYLEHRGRLDRREDPLFLTHRHRPYSTRGR
jgi:hypothetical protein